MAEAAAGRAVPDAAFTSWKHLPGTVRSRAVINGRLAFDVLEESLLLPAVITNKVERQRQGSQEDKH